MHILRTVFALAIESVTFTEVRIIYVVESCIFDGLKTIQIQIERISFARSNLSHFYIRHIQLSFNLWFHLSNQNLFSYLYQIRRIKVESHLQTQCRLSRIHSINTCLERKIEAKTTIQRRYNSHPFVDHPIQMSLFLGHCRHLLDTSLTLGRINKFRSVLNRTLCTVIGDVAYSYWNPLRSASFHKLFATAPVDKHRAMAKLSSNIIVDK